MTQLDTTDDITTLLAILPERIQKVLLSHPELPDLIEIVLDLGKPAEARFFKSVLYVHDAPVTDEEIQHVVSQVGQFTADNRAGIERTLHRISAIRNRRGGVIGLTCRVGRAMYGTIDIIRDVVEAGKSILFLGPPGIGKTTKLREAARVLADDLNKRVVVIDTSNEIAGDGDIPHPGIGKARRMQVSSPDRQHAVMIEAVENHMPEVIIVDEIGTEAEAIAARTIAERGVQLIGTAHGNTLDNVIKNPTLSDLVGGIQSVILSDEEARRRRTQKAILERRALPTFQVAVELRERDVLAIYEDVGLAVDNFLRGRALQPEIRRRTPEGKISVEKIEKPRRDVRDAFTEFVEKEEVAASRESREEKGVSIYPFAVNRRHLERALRALQVPAVVVGTVAEAELVLTTKSRSRPGSKISMVAEEHGIPVHVIRKNTASQIMKFLRFYFRMGGNARMDDESALREVEGAAEEVRLKGQPVDVAPQNSYIRRLQHQWVEQHELRSESIGEEPQRRLRIYPS